MNVIRQAAVLALVFAVVGPLSAQEPPQPPSGRAGPAWGPRALSVEAALRFRDELKLTEGQRSQLEAIRKEIVAERQTHIRERVELQSRAAAGHISWEEVRKQVESQRNAMRPVREQRQERVANILAQEQQDQLRRLTREQMRQRASERRGGRGSGPGMRGRGMGPAGGSGPGVGFRRADAFGRFGR